MILIYYDELINLLLVYNLGNKMNWGWIACLDRMARITFIIIIQAIYLKMAE